MRSICSAAAFVLTLSGCYCSHVRPLPDASRDAGSLDAGIDAGAHIDAGLPPSCGVAEPAAGPFCGGASACVVTRRVIETLGGPSAYELFAEIGSMDDGAILVSYRGTGERLPIAMIRGDDVTFREVPVMPFGSGLFASTTEETYTLGREIGTNRPVIHRVTEDAFIEEPALLGTGIVGGGFTGDSLCLHLILTGASGLERWAVREDRSFFYGPVEGSYASAIRVDSAGEVHVAAASRDGVRWTSGARTETVDPLVTATGSAIHLRLGLAGTEPHVLYLAQEGADIRHAWRTSAGWENELLDTTRHSGCTGMEMPIGPGDQCELERTHLEPIAVLVDQSAAVRLLYGETTEQATLTASCGGEDVPADECFGWTWSSTFESVLHVVAVGDPAEQAVPFEGAAITAGNAIAVGSTMHAALELLGASGMTLEHVELD